MTAQQQTVPWESSWQRPERAKTIINSLAEIDLIGLGLANIRFGCGTGIAISSGSGRYKTHTYRRGVMTDLGDIRADVWYQLVEYFARFYGEEPLVAALLEWSMAHNYGKETAAKLRQHALQDYSLRLFDNPRWVYYIPFNQIYRPDVLRRAHIVTILPACCGKPGLVTREQIDGAYQRSVACPHCGRWSTFSIVEASPDSPAWEK